MVFSVWPERPGGMRKTTAQVIDLQSGETLELQEKGRSEKGGFLCRSLA
tara:strand:+ start:46647 stop:46793 length:147 start_codon:yes stop_codon:yes gene_type:complete